MEIPLPSNSQAIPFPTSSAGSIPATVGAAVPTAFKTGIYVQSAELSPRALANDAGGNTEALAAVPGAKLRLMCSYGGHIMPRPHDKVLTYVSGETRLVVIDRHTSMVSLRSRLSRMLLNGRPFTLKYQLPNEDLDSLVSITTDEDLENMIDEYDRVTSSTAVATSAGTQRIRLFLFANKLDTAATMGSLLEGAKSETWFVDALNQSGLLPRGLSDSAAVDNCFLNLDDSIAGEAEIQTNVNGENNKQGDPVPHHEIQLSSMPDSPMIETLNSSYGSSSSSPSMANLPPIRVRVNEEQRMEDQFAQMSFSSVHIQRHPEEGVRLVVARPPATITEQVTAPAINSAVSDSAIGGCQVPSEDDRSDPGVPIGYRKPPLPLQQVAVPPRTGGGYGMPSPDSVASDSSISSATSFHKPMYHQDQGQAPPRAAGSQPDHTLSSVQPVTYATMDDQQNQPSVQPPYLHHGGVQYIQVYPNQPQNYPFYMMPSVPHNYPAPGSSAEAAQTMYRPTLPPNHQPLQQYVGYSMVPRHPTPANVNANYGGYNYPNALNDPTYYHMQSPAAAAAGPAGSLASQYQSMTPAAAAAALADASKQ